MTKKCKYCSTKRSTKLHLFELHFVFEELLSKPYEWERDGKIRIMHPQNIANWIKLASDLENVDMSTGVYSCSESSFTYCRPAYEEVVSNDNHYKKFATALTRFTYLCNALEEACKYFSNECKKRNLVKKKQPIPKIIQLLDNTERQTPKPVHFDFYARKFKHFFIQYQSEYDVQISSRHLEDKVTISLTLDLIRELRNSVAHGLFPVMNDPEMHWVSEAEGNLINLLNSGVMVICLILQVLLASYRKEEMERSRYYLATKEMLEACGGENIPMIDAYVRDLHIKQEFELNPVYINSAISALESS